MSLDMDVDAELEAAIDASDPDSSSGEDGEDGESSKGKAPPKKVAHAAGKQAQKSRAKARCGKGLKLCKGCGKRKPLTCFAQNQSLDFECKR
eukprot:7425654-Alexandrium_andersonii.AAC.1